MLTNWNVPSAPVVTVRPVGKYLLSSRVSTAPSTAASRVLVTVPEMEMTAFVSFAIAAFSPSTAAVTSAVLAFSLSNTV